MEFEENTTQQRNGLPSLLDFVNGRVPFDEDITFLPTVFIFGAYIYLFIN